VPIAILKARFDPSPQTQSPEHEPSRRSGGSGGRGKPQHHKQNPAAKKKNTGVSGSNSTNGSPTVTSPTSVAERISNLRQVEQKAQQAASQSKALSPTTAAARKTLSPSSSRVSVKSGPALAAAATVEEPKVEPVTYQRPTVFKAPRAKNAIPSSTALTIQAKGVQSSSSLNSSSRQSVPFKSMPPRPVHDWTLMYTSEGQAYYQNAGTRITQWEKPPEIVQEEAWLAQFGGLQ